MINREVSVKFNGCNEILMANSSDYRNDVEISALFFHFNKIGNKRIIFKTNGNQLSIRTDIKGKWLSIVISSFNSLSHF